MDTIALIAAREADGLVATVSAEVYLAYDSRAAEIAARAERESHTAIKNAILRFVLEARLSAMISAPSLQDSEV